VNSANQVVGSAFVLNSSAATITTDKTGYAPGDLVTFRGTGWQPGESVTVELHKSPANDPDIVLNVTAAGDGTYDDRPRRALHRHGKGRAIGPRRSDIVQGRQRVRGRGTRGYAFPKHHGYEIQPKHYV
jgi:hypothetical protein